ncbi:MAG TPA: hypothetical protein DCY86_07125 [Bdellovibrionales bacterium]|nr:hypothetical protein [Bdellovibrionales bacterium]
MTRILRILTNFLIAVGINLFLTAAYCNEWRDRTVDFRVNWEWPVSFISEVEEPIRGGGSFEFGFNIWRFSFFGGCSISTFSRDDKVGEQRAASEILQLSYALSTHTEKVEEKESSKNVPAKI